MGMDVLFKQSYDMENNLRLYYLEHHSDDVLGEKINENITFENLLLCLDKGECVYELIGIHDSLIRERLFTGLSKSIGCEYNDIYTRWLNI